VQYYFFIFSLFFYNIYTHIEILIIFMLTLKKHHASVAAHECVDMYIDKNKRKSEAVYYNLLLFFAGDLQDWSSVLVARFLKRKLLYIWVLIL